MSNTIITITPDFSPYGSVAGTAGTSATRLTLPIDSNNTNLHKRLLLTNGGTGYARYKLGDSSVTADAQSAILRNVTELFLNRGNHTHVSIITDSGTTHISATTGD